MFDACYRDRGSTTETSVLLSVYHPSVRLPLFLSSVPAISFAASLHLGASAFLLRASPQAFEGCRLFEVSSPFPL
jgi:hypothetical protein